MLLKSIVCRAESVDIFDGGSNFAQDDSDLQAIQEEEEDEPSNPFLQAKARKEGGGVRVGKRLIDNGGSDNRNPFKKSSGANTRSGNSPFA